jgi:hypothetical protein
VSVPPYLGHSADARADDEEAAVGQNLSAIKGKTQKAGSSIHLGPGISVPASGTPPTRVLTTRRPHQAKTPSINLRQKLRKQGKKSISA